MCALTERAAILLPTSVRSAEAAREFVRQSGCVEHSQRMLDDALLLVTELVTNSVRHGGAPILLALDCDGANLRVEVRDGNVAFPKPRQASWDDENGRGLSMVMTLAASWGVESVVDEYGKGKTVWFELQPPP